MSEYHSPVLLKEVLEGLDLGKREGGTFLDCTCGGGNHSYAVLESNPTISLIGIDKDDEAIAESERRLAKFQGRFRLFRTDYKNYAEVLDEAGVDKLDGFLVDLGISSHQIDDEKRGFAYNKPDAPLDMRMDRRIKLTAETVVNEYSPEALRKILREYGEESFAGSIVARIVKEREKEPIKTAGRLKEIIEASVPPQYRFHACARKTFQAIRIEVNGELNGLSEFVKSLTMRLKTGARGCVITFHSLEDRIVKNVFRELAAGCVCPKSLPVCVCGRKKEIELVGKQPIVADEREIEENSRSKSAKLRIALKIT